MTPTRVVCIVVVERLSVACEKRRRASTFEGKFVLAVCLPSNSPSDRPSEVEPRMFRLSGVDTERRGDVRIRDARYVCLSMMNVVWQD